MEFKRKVVGELERKEKTIVQLCREHSLAEGQLHKWRKLFGQGAGEAKLVDGKGRDGGAAEIQVLKRKVAELERLCGQITLENAYLKNSLATYPKQRG